MKDFDSTILDATAAWLGCGEEGLEKAFKQYIEENCEETDSIWDATQEFLEDYKDEFVDTLADHLCEYVNDNTKMSLKFVD
jgi:hypothetical protein